MKTRRSFIGITGLVLTLTITLSSPAPAQNSSERAGITSPAPPPPATAAQSARENVPANDQRPTPAVQLSWWANEIAKLAQAGIEDEVQLAFLGSASMFRLGANEVIYLRQLGVSSQVLSAMFQHDYEFASGMRPTDAWTMPSSAPDFQATLATNSQMAVEQIRQATGVAESSSDRNFSPALYNQAIIEEFPELEFLITGQPQPEPPPQVQTVPEEKPAYPIREPYPVKISEPIIVVRIPCVRPNVQILRSFR